MTDGQHPQSLTEMEKEAIGKELKDEFNQLVAALNRIAIGAWSDFYSEDEFLSTIAGAGYFGQRSEWVDFIAENFSMREKQQVEPLEVRITALTPDLALMTSNENSEIWLKTGENFKSKHAFTMIWKKGAHGWKIIHSHESWIDVDAD